MICNIYATVFPTSTLHKYVHLKKSLLEVHFWKSVSQFVSRIWFTCFWRLLVDFCLIVLCSKMLILATAPPRNDLDDCSYVRGIPGILVCVSTVYSLLLHAAEDLGNWNAAVEQTDGVVHWLPLEGQTQNQLILPKSEPWLPRVKCTADLWSVGLWGPLLTAPCAIHQSDGQWLGSGPNITVCHFLRGPRTVRVCL